MKRTGLRGLSIRLGSILGRKSDMGNRYDLEERTFHFASKVRQFVRELEIRRVFGSDLQQLIKASGSIGANYIEANESLGHKDFIYGLKISRKEAKEAIYWLRLVKGYICHSSHAEIDTLIDEATELRRILSTIIKKAQ